MDGNAAPNPGRTMRVLIADDHPGMVEEAALAAALESKPDIVLLDIEMPHLDGIQVSHELLRSGGTSRIVFVTMHEDADYICHAFECGASGYVFKSRLGSDLLTAVEEVLAGRKFASAERKLQNN